MHLNFKTNDQLVLTKNKAENHKPKETMMIF